MINFDSLPNTAPAGSSIIEKGTYIAEIVKAEMRAPKDSSKAPYMNLQYKVSKTSGEAVGTIFDIITEPEKDMTKYKLRRFIEALKLPISGNFELKDLTKIVVGKKFGIDVKVDDESQTPRSVVDVFAGKIYYTLEEVSGTKETTDINEYLSESTADVGENDTAEANY